MHNSPKKKKSSPLFLAAMCLNVFAAAIVIAQSSVRFSLPNNAAGASGETVTIPLLIDPQTHAIGSFDATVEFRNPLLTYTGFSNGPILAANDGWIVDVNGNNAQGKIVIGAFSFKRITGAGAALLLKFLVDSAASGGDTSRLSLRGLAATDTNAVALPITEVTGKFTVKPSIYGRIQTTAGTALHGVSLAGPPENFATDTGGYYRIIVDPGWAGQIIPTQSGYTFEPPTRQYPPVIRDQHMQDYAGLEIFNKPFAFPNPFTPTLEAVQIRFALKTPSRATLKILDGSGEVIKEITNLRVDRADFAQTFVWDGRTSRGDFVDSGIYFYVIEAPGNSRLVGKVGVLK